MKPQPWSYSHSLSEIKAITPLCVLSWYRVNMPFHACTPVCGNTKPLFSRALADLNIKAENLFRCVPHMLFPHCSFDPSVKIHTLPKFKLMLPTGNKIKGFIFYVTDCMCEIWFLLRIYHNMI